MSASPGQQPRLWPLYLGGLLGPFGGAVTNTMLPELAAGLGSDLQTASSAVLWYMLPFSAVLLVSGSLAQRWGRGRTIRGGFALYVFASLVCIAAAWLPAAAVVPVFMAGRALQGIGNAFTTPVLVALLSEFVPAKQLGATLGVFASMQAAGQAFSPLVGGISADLDWRVAFVVSGLVALVLVVVTPTGRSGAAAGPANWRALANPRLLQSSLIGFSAQVTTTGVSLLAALVATDRFGLSPTARGLVVAVYGVAGLVSGRLAGRLADRFGIRTVGVTALLLLAAAMTLVGLAPWLVLLLLLVGTIGAAGTATRVLTNTLALRSTPENTGGATSVSMAVQFLGGAVVPVLVPLYLVSPLLATGVAGAVAVVGAAIAALRLPPARPSTG